MSIGILISVPTLRGGKSISFDAKKQYDRAETWIQRDCIGRKSAGTEGAEGVLEQE